MLPSLFHPSDSLDFSLFLRSCAAIMHSMTLGFVNWDKEAQKAVQRLEGMQEPPQKQQQQQQKQLGPAVVMVVEDGLADKTRVDDDVVPCYVSGDDSGCRGSQQLKKQQESGVDEERTMLLAAAAVHGSSSSDQLPPPPLGTIHEEDHPRGFTVEAIITDEGDDDGGPASGEGQKEKGCH